MVLFLMWQLICGNLQKHLENGLGWNYLADNKKQMWIPEGFAHGFLVLSEQVEFLYKTTDYWHSASEQCIAWNDPNLNIQWPNLSIEIITNQKDKSGLDWHSAPKFK